MEKSFKFSVEDITEGGLMVSLALILNFIKIPIGSSGGSINLQLLPLFIYSLRKGVLKGFIVSGLVYGVASCTTDPYGSLINFPLDYLLGFGSCCIVGINQKIKNNQQNAIIFVIITCLVATLIRLLFATISGVVIYETGWLGSLIYNSTYVLISGAASTIALVLLLLTNKKLIQK